MPLYRITTTLNQPVVEIDIDPEDVFHKYEDTQDWPEKEAELEDAALDDFYYHYLKQSVIDIKIEKVDE